jgi:hypothetical protein
MKRAFLVSVVALFCLVPFALADRVVGTVTSASARITHGDWQRLPDGGFRYTVCGEAALTDGGPAPAGLFTCSTCEPGSWNAAPGICTGKWRIDNGI